MKRKQLLGLIILLLIIAGAGLFFYFSKQSHASVYTNPVGGISNIGDPFVLKDGDDYYMYATSEASFGFKVWYSNNLVDWEEKGLAYAHYNQPSTWATGDFWAPEVIKYGDQFYMTYSARNEGGHLQISIATSKDPLGPFIDIATEIIDQEGSYIDGNIFIDVDGTPYLYYVKDCSENIIDDIHISQIFVQEMNKELTEVLGEPVLLLQQDTEWEGLEGDYQWNEGPFVLKHDKTYYLMYSANFYASEDYSIGYATADQPFGPFKKAEENPVLAKDLERGISGPGHNSVTVGLDGETLYAVYHTHTFAHAPSGNRQMNIDKLYFKNGKLKIDGPTSDEQKLN